MFESSQSVKSYEQFLIWELHFSFSHKVSLTQHIRNNTQKYDIRYNFWFEKSYFSFDKKLDPEITTE